MARGLGLIRVRFGLWIAGTVLVTAAVLGACVMLFAEWQYASFYRNLPTAVREELEALQDADMDDSPRVSEIYRTYWSDDLLFGERWSLLIGLLVCLPVGLGAGLWVSRVITQPLASIAGAAQRVALGDFSVRAEAGSAKGEMAEMVRDFNHMTDSLERLEHERTATAAAVSHELRTPLTVLRARLHAVCDGVIQPDPAEFRILLDQVEHLGRLVDDLHTLSMADGGRLSLQRVDVDLAALVTDTVAGYAGPLAELGIVPEFTMAELPAVVHADPDRMRQVVSNLVENVLRYASEGRWLGIALQVEPSSAEVVLAISDAGAGLPEDIRQTLFQRFRRAGSSDARRNVGSGLGLSIVHTLVVRQGGSIEADSSARGGTRFVIRLPMVATSAA